MTMDASRRGALLFVCFTAACLMGMGVVELGLCWAQYKINHVQVNVPLAVLWGILFLTGAAILIKAKAAAEWVAGKLE
jgi:hypothetical protein